MPVFQSRSKYEDAPAAADPATGRGSRPRDETDEQPRREPRPRSPPPEPMPQPPWFEEEVAAKIQEAAQEAAQAEAASKAAPMLGAGGAGDLSAALKMFGAMVVMDREADAQRCARLVGSMPPSMA